jgi:hypothetical protein
MFGLHQRLAGLVVLCFCLAQSGALAWQEAGHKLVASIAYSELATRERAAVDAILKQHTNYSSWRAEFDRAQPSASLGQFVFMEASTWADKIRDSHNPDTHPEWHYINYPLRPPDFPEQPAPSRTNVVSAIEEAMAVLQDQNASRSGQAESLAWLIHLVGDIHQPLHCTSLFGGSFDSRDGDRGGNSFWIKLKEDSARPVKLHTLWDGLPGTGKDPDRLVKKAEEWKGAHRRRDYPANAFGGTAATWSQEGRRLALEQIYRPLPGLDGRESRPILAPADYFRDSKALAEAQVTLAGYRLADQIHLLLAGR